MVVVDGSGSQGEVRRPQGPFLSTDRAGKW